MPKASAKTSLTALENGEEPAVSVVVPIYNSGAYLAECIDSILAQTFMNYEIVCIDDGSTDNSLSIAKEYAAKDKRIRILTQSNAGVVSAKNNAIKAARGKYIFPLDSDDVIAPATLEILHGIITTTKYKAVCPLGFLFGEENKPWMMPKPSRWNMYSRSNGLHNSTMYPRELWEKYGGYDERFAIGGEDYDFLLNFIDDHQPVFQTRERLFYYRIKPPSESRSTASLWNKSRENELCELLFEKRPIMRRYDILKKILKVPKKTLRFFFHIPLSEAKGTRSIRILGIPVVSWRVPEFSPYVERKVITKVAFLAPEIASGRNAHALMSYLDEIKRQKKWILRVYSLARVKDEPFIQFCRHSKIRLRSGWDFPVLGTLALKFALASADVLVDSELFDFDKVPGASAGDARRLIDLIQDAFLKTAKAKP